MHKMYKITMKTNFEIQFSKYNNIYALLKKLNNKL